MKDIIGRLYRIAKSYTISGADPLKHHFEDPQDPFEDLSFSRSKQRTSSSQHQKKDTSDSSGSSSRPHRQYANIPQQIVKDLATFNLSPPSSLKEARKARNREIKKYHSDRFMNDPEKMKTSKEIMQIYNAAYDRLKRHYAQNDR